MPQQKKKSETRKAYSLIAMTGSPTFLFVLPILISIFGGLLIDKFFKTTPLFVIAGTIVGFIVGMTSILFFLYKLSKN